MKKTAILALFGLVAVQSSSVRKFLPEEELDLFSLKKIGESIGKVADNVGHAVGQAATSVGDAVGQAGQAVGKTATNVGDAVGQAATNVGDAVGQAGQAVGKTAVTVGKAVGKAGQDVGEVVANDFQNGAGFAQAVYDWGHVDLKNATSILDALQATAVGCSTFFTDLNDLTGGKLNSEDLDAASAVASAVFPPAAIVIDAGKIILNVGTDAEDITPLIEGITSGIQSKDYLEVIIDAFQIFKMLYQIIA